MRNWEILTMFGGAHSMFLAVAILPNFLALPLFIAGGAIFAISPLLGREPEATE